MLFTDDLKRATAISSALLNAVNCSTAPNCTDLNRYSCSAVAGTCGVCMDGFVGDKGHQNSYCFFNTQRGNQSLSGFSLPPSTGLTCSTSSECLSGRWEECVDGMCSVVSQKCPNDCSSHGMCKYQSIINSSVTYNSCSILDFDCKALCFCHADYHGSDCASSSSEFYLMQKLRYDIVKTIHNISQIEDLTADSLKAWISSLASLTTDPESLNFETKSLITEMTIDFVEKALALGLSFEDTINIAVLVDFSLLGRSSVDNAASAYMQQSMETLLRSYSQFIAADMSDGQNPISLIRDGFRLQTVSFTDTRKNATLGAPLSSLESLFGKPANEATLAGGDGENAYKVTVLERASGNASNMMSVRFGLDFDRSPCTTTDSSACVVTVVLQHLLPLPEAENFTESVRFECKKKVIEEHEYMCSNGHVLTTFCNGSLSGVLNHVCPRYHPSPACKSLGNTPSNCIAISSTAANVTCQCTLPVVQQAFIRNLQSSGDDDSSGDSAVSVNFAAAGTTILVEFVETWKSAGSLSARDVKGSWQALVTVASIGIISILLMLLGWRTDTTAAESEAKEAADKKKVEKAMVTATDDIRKRIVRRNSSWERVLRPGAADNLLRRKSTAQKPPSARQRTKSFVVPPEKKTVESALPLVLQPLPLWKKYLIEAQVYHR
jgi:hypothetical protein